LKTLKQKWLKLGAKWNSNPNLPQMSVGKFDASFSEFCVRLIAIIFEISQTRVHTKFMNFLFAAEKGENSQN
jgi:hypothetical protein